MGSNNKEMKNADVNELEAIVCGTGTAALFAGFILRKNRIRFVLCDHLIGEGTDLELDDNHMHKAEVMFQGISVQVGFDSKADDEKEYESGIDRLNKFLLYELEDARTDATTEELLVYVSEGVPVIDAQGDWQAAGASACALAEMKQKRMAQYMQKLRIKSGTRTQRKLVYATHSKNWFYARDAVMKFTVDAGVAAINPYMNYNFYLGGSVDKDEIVECCHQIIRSVSEMWVFGPVSEAILTDIVVAVMEGKEIRFFSVSENPSEIHEIPMDEIIFEREVHAGQIKKADLLNFVRNTLPRSTSYVQMSLFDNLKSMDEEDA